MVRIFTVAVVLLPTTFSFAQDSANPSQECLINALMLQETETILNENAAYIEEAKGDNADTQWYAAYGAGSTGAGYFATKYMRSRLNEINLQHKQVPASTLGNKAGRFMHRWSLRGAYGTFIGVGLAGVGVVWRNVRNYFLTKEQVLELQNQHQLDIETFNQMVDEFNQTCGSGLEE